MRQSYLILDFVSWYYTRAFIDIVSVWSNFFWFTIHFFSIPLLLRTLFSPWKRMTDPYSKQSLESFFETLIVNIMSRLLGAFVRTFIIVAGIVCISIGTLSLIAFLVLWIFLPVFFVVTTGFGISLFFV